MQKGAETFFSSSRTSAAVKSVMAVCAWQEYWFSVLRATEEHMKEVTSIP